MFRRVFPTALVLASLVTTAQAQDIASATGLFIDVNVGAAFRSGTSNTTTGGRFHNGTVKDVHFSEAYAVGGQIGYRLSEELAAFVSVNHISGGLNWAAWYSGIGDSRFRSRASSTLILANAAYSYSLSEATALTATAGLGLSINDLSDIFESSTALGEFAKVGSNTQYDAAARLGLSLSHEIAPSLTLGLDGALTYTGGFSTGHSRSRIDVKATEAIGPYAVQNVWAATVTASLKARF